MLAESPLDLDVLGSLRELALAEVGKVVLGQQEAIELMLVAAAAGGHVLLEGPPGTAKTLLSGSVARVIGVGRARRDSIGGFFSLDRVVRGSTPHPEPILCAFSHSPK